LHKVESVSQALQSVIVGSALLAFRKLLASAFGLGCLLVVGLLGFEVGRNEPKHPFGVVAKGGRGHRSASWQ